MSSLVVFNEHTSANLFHNTTLENIKRLVPDCIVYDGTKQSNLDYFVKNKDNRIYEGVLDFCTENKIENLHILYLTSPELLLAEIKYRYFNGKAFNTKITFVMDWRIIEISKARQKVMDDLLQYPCINKMFIFSSMGEESKYIGSYNQDFFSYSKKIVRFYVPVYADIKPYPMDEARKEYDLPQDRFILLFFGAMHYGKGIDLLLRAMKEVDDNVLLFIVSGEGRNNFEISDELLNQHNVEWLKRSPPNEELSKLFATANIVALPYRSTYKNCGSSVLVQACQANKNVIMPDIIPFNYVVQKYTLGELFEADNIKSLIETINFMALRKSKYMGEFCKYYLDKIQNWETYVEAIF